MEFDPSRKNSHVVSHQDPHGADFRIFGVMFDTKFCMHAVVHKVAVECAWKLTALLRSRRYRNAPRLLLLLRAKLLSYIECRIPVIYNVLCSSLFLRQPPTHMSPGRMPGTPESLKSWLSTTLAPASRKTCAHVRSMGREQRFSRPVRGHASKWWPWRSKYALHVLPVQRRGASGRLSHNFLRRMTWKRSGRLRVAGTVGSAVKARAARGPLWECRSALWRGPKDGWKWRCEKVV